MKFDPMLTTYPRSRCSCCSNPACQRAICMLARAAAELRIQVRKASVTMCGLKTLPDELLLQIISHTSLRDRYTSRAKGCC